MPTAPGIVQHATTNTPFYAPVTPDQIDGLWPEIEAGLAIVARKAPAEWTSEEVRDACRSLRAFLFHSPDGFFILQPLAPDTVHVWIAYGTGRNLIPQYLPKIEDLARAIGARRLTFTSVRPGYRRVMRGWIREGNHYTRILM